jgi:hypothetical protein
VTHLSITLLSLIMSAFSFSVTPFFYILYVSDCDFEQEMSLKQL